MNWVLVYAVGPMASLGGNKQEECEPRFSQNPFGLIPSVQKLWDY